MANKTYIPAFKARVGDWNYYICQMKYAEVARSVSFAFELGGNKDLSSLIQRGLHKRTEEITDYLLTSEHRFLGSLIIATWGGEPEYLSLRMEDPDGMLAGIDREFGVLTLDGTHSFFALDGQHRLKAIKDAIKADPRLGSEDICVLLVTHQDTEDGRERTQRLFTNINRNAKTTTAAENIALDVDDAFAILTRRLLTDHDFLGAPKRVRVFSKPPTDDGEFTLAGKSIPKTDAGAWTSITVLHEMIREISWDAGSSITDASHRPSDSDLDEAYDTVSKRLDDLLIYCGDLQKQIKAAQSARDLRAPKDKEAAGHAFMRPVVQQAVSRVTAHLIDQDLMTWDEVMAGLAKLPWTIGTGPWTAVFNPANSKMVTAKENTRLLDDLLAVHLSPQSRAQIKRARKDYKDIIGSNYSSSEDDLAKKIKGE